METSIQRRLHLVLLPCPAQGHLSPMLQLGAVLSFHGFSITIAHTSFNFPDPSNHPQFHFISIASTSPDDDIAGDGDFLSIMSKLNTNFKAALKNSLRHMIEQCESKDETVACLIYDGVMYFAEEVARELRLPCMVFRADCAANLRVHNEYPRLQEEGYIPLQVSKLLELVPGLYPLRFKDLSIYKFGNLEGLLQEIDRMGKPRSSSAVIFNTTEILDQEALIVLQRQHQIPVFAVGPLHKIAPPFSSSLLEEDTTCITWLDKQAKKSVLYVSMGSIANINEKELVEMAWGLADSHQPFLWVIRPGSVRGSAWTEMLPERFAENVGQRGLIIKWAPQRTVLAHESVGGFWSHCGWNSTLESVSEGVPMICTPAFGDQKLNARYLSHMWKVGMLLEDMERTKIAKAIEKLMVSSEGQVMRQMAMDLKQSVEDSVTEGGSSYRSLETMVDLIRSLK